MSIKVILLFVAFILFVLSALGVGSPRFDRFGFMAVGLALWVLSQIVGS